MFLLSPLCKTLEEFHKGVPMTKSVLLSSAALALLASPVAAEMNFNRIASFPVTTNFEGAVPEETSAEIIDATEDGMTLVYTDSPAGVIGAIDISDPANPQPLGVVEMDGEPTAVSIIGTTAFVGINTSESYTEPSGMVKAIDVTSMTELSRCDLGGQPDSTGKAPDGSFIAIAIENERDEDLGEGRVPQMPAGDLVMINVVAGSLDCDSLPKLERVLSATMSKRRQQARSSLGRFEPHCTVTP